MRTRNWHLPQTGVRPGRSLALLGATCALIAGLAHAQTASELAYPDLSGGDANRPPATSTRSSDRQNDIASRFQGLSGLPYASSGGARRSNYNLRLGPVDALFFASMGFSYSDNVYAAPSGGRSEDDFSINPGIGMSFTLPLSETHEFRTDVGISYHSSFRHPELDRLSIAPSSHLDYRIILGDVLITFFDTASSASEPSSRPELGASGNAFGVDFSRVQNSLGVAAQWAATDKTVFSASYNYGIERGFNDAYTLLDHDGHNFSAAVFHEFHPMVTLGLNSFYSISDYLERFQNNGTTYGGGPVISFSPSPFITLSASVSYTLSEYGNTGALSDRAQFAGFTYQVSAMHRITRHLSHSLSFSQGVNNGIGSNFTESTGVTYGFGWQFHPKLGVNAGISFVDFKQSGSVVLGQAQRLAFLRAVLSEPRNAGLVAGSISDQKIRDEFIHLYATDFGAAVALVEPLFPNLSILANDRGQTVQMNVGTGLNITKNLNGSLSYSHFIRESDFQSASYSGNSVTLSFTYRF